MKKAPEITGDLWFNTKALKPKDLKDKVILYSFWSYGYGYYVSEFDHLRNWWHKYKNLKFLIIGVYVPKSDSKRERGFIEEIIKKLGIEWPIVFDKDCVNWRNFNVQNLPMRYLINREGDIIYSHPDKGSYTETEKEIQKRIRENLGDIPLPEVREELFGERGVCYLATPKLYLGYSKGLISNPEGYRMNEFFNYQQPEQITEDTIALKGPFRVMPAYLENGASNSIIFLRFHGTEVNLTIRPIETEKTIIETMFNGDVLDNNLRGRDIKPNGKEVEINLLATYNLIKSRRPIEGVLSIRSKKGKFRAYAFTFSGCVE